MKAFSEYSIPISGLTSGVYSYQFSLNESFFSAFEEGSVKNGQIHADVELDKKPGMLVFEMRIHGTVVTQCDRCLVTINLPIQNEYQLIVKMAAEAREEGEVVYISYEDNHFQLAPYLKELVELSLPISKVYDCQEEEPFPCDSAMLDKLEGKEQDEVEEDGESPWNVLKDIDLN